MSLFKEELGPEESLFRDLDALDPEFLPKRLLHREGEVQEIARAIKPALIGRKPQNIFIHGVAGTGKTSVVKYIFSQLEQETSKAVSIYVNCWEKNTRFEIVSQILRKLGIFVPIRGISFSEAYRKLLNYLKKEALGLIVALDEIDQLIFKNNRRLLYDLSRSGENIGLLLITNEPYVLGYLDPRTKSSLALSDLEFRPYTFEELFDIYKDRINLAFRPAVLKDLQIKKVARYVERYGDVRIGLEVLRRAGSLAEEKASKVVSEVHLNSAISNIEKVRKIEKIEGLKRKEAQVYRVLRAIARIVAEKKLAYVSDVYDHPEVKGRVPERTVRHAIHRLSELGFLKYKEGKKRSLELEIPLDTVLSF